MNPLVSVIIPCYNAENTIKESVNSILHQTYTSLEVIIINDGSNDNSLEIINSIIDNRIRVIDNVYNKGLIYSLNRGLSLSKGKYIARMDADDISIYNRIELQVDYMENNPKVVALGGQIECFGRKGVKALKVPTTDAQIRFELNWHNPFCHPTMMLRRDVLVDNNLSYNMNYLYCEDYKLWSDLSKYGLLSNLKDVLLKYRLAPSQVTQSHGKEMMQNTRNVRKDFQMISQLDLNINYSFITKDDIIKVYRYFKINKCQNEDWAQLELLTMCLSMHNSFKAFLIYLIKIMPLSEFGFKNCLRLFLSICGSNKWSYLKYE